MNLTGFEKPMEVTGVLKTPGSNGGLENPGNDVLKLFGQAFSMACLVNTKARDRKTVEDQRVKERIWIFIRR